MKQILSFILSMKMAAILLVVSIIALAQATFIENDYGTAAAQAMVYKAWWFELIIAVLALNVTISMLRLRPLKTHRWGVFVFHLAFVLMVLGAALTRYIGQEGSMWIREGQAVDYYFSAEDYISLTDAEGHVLYQEQLLFSPISEVDKSVPLQLQDKAYQLHLSDYKPAYANAEQRASVQVQLLDASHTTISTFILWNVGIAEETVFFRLQGYDFGLRYGKQKRQLPFALFLKDFVLERYPASHSPSGYASMVELQDGESRTEVEIAMNKVLDYRGYRFFQSSYDTDEQGTILSVNKDFWGMLFTYIGYALMALGMFVAVFERSSLFQRLLRSKVLLLAMLLPALGSLAQTSSLQVNHISDAHIEALSQLVVQDKGGRFQPFNSLSSRVVRKFSRRLSYQGVDADRILLGMMLNPNYWVQQPMIKVSNSKIAELIGDDRGRVPFAAFFETNSERYKLQHYVETAYRKKASNRDKFDKDVITVDERVNVFYMAMHQDFMHIFPVPQHADLPWQSPKVEAGLPISTHDSLFMSSIFTYYLQAVGKAAQTGQEDDIDKMLAGIKRYQIKYYPDIQQYDKKLRWELQYNKYDVFHSLFAYYGIFGFVMLLLVFAELMKPQWKLRWPLLALSAFIFISFVAHGLGLAARWYISGHAPWSNGYETMIFVGWVSILAGLLFYKKSPVALATSAVLTALIMYVAHLSWMNPEITFLVPVLQSYWLALHVAIITASYAFLALGAMLGGLHMLFYMLMKPATLNRLQGSIGELTRINQMSMIIGLYMLTIGTFLGGVWANESWGRYWGWDPKETWALITILVYAVLGHLRYIPALKNDFLYNMLSIFAYGSVLMTFFGVNYYLSGLHSYSGGEPMPIPAFVLYAVLAIVGLCVWAAVRYVLVRQQGTNSLKEE